VTFYAAFIKRVERALKRSVSTAWQRKDMHVNIFITYWQKIRDLLAWF